MDHLGLTYNLPGTVSGVFFTKKDADAAYRALLNAGHTPDDISVLMSDETLSNNKAVYVHNFSGEETRETPFRKARQKIADALISITARMSIPRLGFVISSRFFKSSYARRDSLSEMKATGEGASLADTHLVSPDDGMREGGIIISVDPRNADEKREIVNAFIRNNGHDILGDDGYTELH